jgi:hypothetical protein
VTASRAAIVLAAGVIASAAALARTPAHAAAPSGSGAGGPAASALLQRGLSDGRLLANADPEQRAAGIAVARSVGARVARIPIGWSTVVSHESFTRPDESARPLSDPANATYRWARIDASVRDLSAAGLRPLAYLMAAPPWAQSAPRYAYATPGTWAPRPADLAAFASAVARRYDGTYPDPLNPGRALPRIAEFQTWNEPNLARYLGPQWLAVDGRPQLFSVRWYRRMHAAAYAAIHARQPDATVGLAGLAPTGAEVDGTGRVGPLRFLRSLLCLGDRRDACGAPLPFDALALHPLSVGDPDRPARDPDDLALADLAPKVQTLLADARAAGRLRPGPDPALWITELNWTSAPGTGIRAADQAAVVGRAMLRLQLAGATLVNWQFATDPPTDRTGGEDRPAGLTTILPGDARRLPGAPKPFLAGFAMPAAAIPLGRRATFVWALAPAGSAARSALVEVRRGGAWLPAGRLPLRPDASARGELPIPAGALLRVRIGDRTSGPLRALLRLRLRRPEPAEPTVPTGERAVRASSGAAEDPREPDGDGPGPVPAFPPLTPGGTPPTPGGRPIPPVAAPVRPARRLQLRGTPGDDLLIGSSRADHLIGGGGNDLIIGMGGADRITAGPGRATIVRGRLVQRR